MPCTEYFKSLIRNPLGTGWEHDNRKLPSLLVVHSVISLVACLDMLATSTNTPSTKHTIPIVTFFWVWFGFVLFLSFYLFIYLLLLLFCGGSCLGFCSLGVLGVGFLFFLGDGSLFVSLLVQYTLCPHCFGLYIFNDILRHVQSAHLLVSLIFQASQVV